MHMGFREFIETWGFWARVRCLGVRVLGSRGFRV